jgi:alpha-beta hydrolase superfamily lysophospholipase
MKRMHSRNRMSGWTAGARAAALPAAALLAAGCAAPREFHGFRTSDGITIAADLHLPRDASARNGGGAPLVVLAHQLGRDRRSWDPLVSKLSEAGFAAVAFDHRGFGESTVEVASPAELSDLQKESMHLDLVELIPAVSSRPDVDGSRVAVVGSGLSVTPAVRCAMQHSTVRALVLLTGNIQAEEEQFLVEHPELPVLLVAASGDAQGSYLMERYGSHMTGEHQRYFEIGPIDEADPADWRGTDGLTEETGLADLVVWFLERSFSPSAAGAAEGLGAASSPGAAARSGLSPR